MELARRHFRVTGVDRTASYLSVAQAQAEREGLTIEFVEDDVRHFKRPEAFDYVISLYTSFGYFESEEDNMRVLKNACISLKHGGKFIVELMGKEVLAQVFRERDWKEEGGVLLLKEHKIRENWTKIENTWTVVADDKKEFVFTHWLYSARELSTFLRESGFQSVDVYGSLEGGPYDHTATRLVTVAQKE